MYNSRSNATIQSMNAKERNRLQIANKNNNERMNGESSSTARLSSSHTVWNLQCDNVERGQKHKKEIDLRKERQKFPSTNREKARRVKYLAARAGQYSELTESSMVSIVLAWSGHETRPAFIGHRFTCALQTVLHCADRWILYGREERKEKEKERQYFQSH